MNIRLGISSWTYPWAIGVSGYPAPPNPLSPFDLLEKAKNLGVDTLQIADNLPLDSFNERELNNLLEKAQKLGIQIEVGTRGVEPEHLLKYLKIAQILHAKLLRTLTHSGNLNPDLKQVENWIEMVLPWFIETGVSIGIENYESFKAREFADLMRQINSPNVGICLDTVNNYGALEGTEEVVRELMPFTINLHIKDFQVNRVDYKMGFFVTGSPAGIGRLNIEWLLQQVAQNGRDISVTLEQWPTYTGSIDQTILIEEEWAQKGIAYLKHLIEQQGR